MLTHNVFGHVLFTGSMWINHWTGQRWGGFQTYGGMYVNLPLEEVQVLA